MQERVSSERAWQFIRGQANYGDIAIVGEVVSMARDLLDVRKELEEAMDALTCLHAEQNGSPLIRHEAAWNAAMGKAEAILRTARAAAKDGKK